MLKQSEAPCQNPLVTTNQNLYVYHFNHKQRSISLVLGVELQCVSSSVTITSCLRLESI